MRNNVVRTITSNAIVAAVNFVLTSLSYPIAFLGIQVRIAETLVLPWKTSGFRKLIGANMNENFVF